MTRRWLLAWTSASVPSLTITLFEALMVGRSDAPLWNTPISIMRVPSSRIGNANALWSSSQTIPHRLNERQSGRVTHPCHPLNGYAFEPIRLFNSLGNLRVEFFDPHGQQISLPIGCTTLAEEDPYIHFSGSKGLFRVPDLLELIEILTGLKSQLEATSTPNKCQRGVR